MSVFTRVERDELVALLRHYDAGKLLDYQDISDGIENTNYFVTTDQRRMVLTLFETRSLDDMGFFLNLMEHLQEHGIPGARPVADRAGHYLHLLRDRPTALIERLEGACLEHPGNRQCALLGATLAKLHLAGRNFTGMRANGRGHDWRMATAQQLLDHIPSDDARYLRKEIDFQQAHLFGYLPAGIIHASLFRDNVLWDGDRLTGIIDLYCACNDALLHDWHFPRPGEITHRKDPNVFRRILLRHQQHARPLRIAA